MVKARGQGKQDAAHFNRLFASVNIRADSVRDCVTSFGKSNGFFTAFGDDGAMKQMRQALNTLMSRARALLPDRRGNVAMMFALTLVPISIAAGAGLDYWRAVLVRQQMSEALDAAALAVGSTAGLDSAHATIVANTYFNANYKVDRTAYGGPTVSVSNYDNQNGTVTITASDTMPTTVMAAAGQMYAKLFGGAVWGQSLNVSTATTVVWGQSKLWVALVLDNSGSMADSGKMTALISSSQALLTTLQNASSTPGDVQVGIVPFVSVVNVGKSNVGASWLDWTDWEAAPALNVTSTSNGTAIADGYVIPKNNIKFDAYGTGDDCPFTTSSSGGVSQDSPFGYYCTTSSTNNAANVTKSKNSAGVWVSPIPAAGICPSENSGQYSIDHWVRYYNGCWAVSKVTGKTIQVSSGSSATCGGFSTSNCSCTGSGSAKVCKTQQWKHTWTPNNHSTWNGCIIDRNQDNDIQNTQPSGTSGMPPANITGTCLNATVTPLGYNWSSLNTQIGNMQAAGSTNQAIGVANGWQMLTPGNPYGTPAVPANTARYIILLSDGLNTQDRWWGNGSSENTTDDQSIDDRENKACAAAKADGVIIYSLYVNINNSDGNSAPLSNCATDSSKYFVLSSSSQIAGAFAAIAQQITNVRVSK
jgi:Flp pilus assembly protein TadG